MRQVGGGHIAAARVVERLVRMEVDRLAFDGLVLLVECLEDEDDGDEHGKALLGESRDVAHQRAQVERDHDEQQQRQPHPNPETQLQVVDILASTHTWNALPSTVNFSKLSVFRSSIAKVDFSSFFYL